jgi:hypothetical protein
MFAAFLPFPAPAAASSGTASATAVATTTAAAVKAFDSLRFMLLRSKSLQLHSIGILFFRLKLQVQIY